MATYEARRQANIQRNKALVKDLGLEDGKRITASEDEKAAAPPPPRKKRKGPAGVRDHQQQQQPTRSSARIRSAPARPVYTEHAATTTTTTTTTATAAPAAGRRGKGRKAAGAKPRAITAAATGKDVDDDADEEEEEEESDPANTDASSSVASLIAGWTSWTPAAPAPELVDGDPAVDAGAAHYRFASHPDFRPNKSPEAILREGAFGGTYFRPLRPRRLLPGKGSAGVAVVVVEGDWRELPGSWTRGLDPATHLASPDYDAAVNKFGVACGQSIEAWEAAGWISHAHDVRGWFQWYCRFWMGRRCGGGGDDGGDGEDERQIARWKRCVGERGRWRRALLRKYVQMGVRSVADEGDDEDGDEGGGGNNVSPVVHQTCHHWAWEVRQEVLDRFWEEEGGG